MLESENGVFARFITDSLGSRCLQLDAEELAVVVFKNFSLLRPARGLRHDPGSGRGIRTLCEYLTLHFSLNFDARDSLVDVTLNIQPDETDESKEMDDARSGDSRGGPGSGTRRTPQPRGGRGFVHPRTHKTAFASFEEVGPEMRPLLIPQRTCLQLVQTEKRRFNRRSCDIVTSIDDLIFVTETVSHFLGEQTVGSLFGNFTAESDTHDSKQGGGGGHGGGFTEYARSQFPATPKQPAFASPAPLPDTPISPRGGSASCLSIFFLARIADIKLILVDDVLGLHRPFAQTYFLELEVASIVAPTPAGVSKLAKLLSPSGVVTAGHGLHTGGGGGMSAGVGADGSVSERLAQEIDASQLWYTVDAGMENGVAGSPKVVMLYGRSQLWVDAFNSILRCWEPALEHSSLQILHEQSPLRGQGLVVLLDKATHFNMSSTALLSLHEILHIYVERILRMNAHEDDDDDDDDEMDIDILDERVGRRRSSALNGMARIKTASVYSPLTGTGSVSGKRSARHASMVVTKSSSMEESPQCASAGADDVLEVPVVEHHLPLELGRGERAGFSIENSTGQTLRYLQSWEGRAASRKELHYLPDNGKGILNFSASEKIMRDGTIVEEAYKVQTGDNAEMVKENVTHELTMQVSGYKWLTGIQSNTFGLQVHTL